MAVDAGHVESTCVRDRGWAGCKDWQLMEHVIVGDFTLVTHNSTDFRGGGPGRLGGEHARRDIHAGLVCLNSSRVMDLDRQIRLFRVALDELQNLDDLVNQALEVHERDDDSIELLVYDIPELR